MLTDNSARHSRSRRMCVPETTYTLYRTCADEYVVIVHWTCVILGLYVLSRSSLTLLRYPGPSRGCVLGEVGQLISLDLVPP